MRAWFVLLLLVGLLADAPTQVVAQEQKQEAKEQKQAEQKPPEQPSSGQPSDGQPSTEKERPPPAPQYALAGIVTMVVLLVVCMPSRKQ